MKRGPKPKSANQRKTDGSRPRTDQEQEADIIVFSDGTPNPPRHLCARGKAVFKQLAKELYQAGILRKVDAPTLAEYCQAVADVERLTLAIRKSGGEVILSRKGGPMHNPRVGYLKEARRTIRMFGAKLGLNPRDRSLIKAPPKDVPTNDEVDDMAQFDAG